MGRPAPTSASVAPPLASSTPRPAPGRVADPTALAPRIGGRIRAARSRRAERAHARDCAERRQRREELLASISHELRTPLSSVVGYTEVLLSGDAGELSEQQSAMLGRVAANGERLLHLIEELLCAASSAPGQGDGAVVDVIDVIHVVTQQLDVPPAAVAAHLPAALGTASPA